MNQTILQPIELDSTLSDRWMVVIFNNEVNDVGEVVDILMEATGCTPDEAYMEMWEAHHFGKAPVHFDGRLECERVAAIIESIGVQTAVSKEWND